MKNILKPLAKSVLIPLGLTTAASAADAAIHKKMFGSGYITWKQIWKIWQNNTEIFSITKRLR